MTKFTIEYCIKAIWDYAINEKPSGFVGRETQAEQMDWRLECSMYDSRDRNDLVEIVSISKQSLTEADNIVYKMRYSSKSTNEITLIGTGSHKDKQLHTPFLEQLNQIWAQHRRLYQNPSC